MENDSNKPNGGRIYDYLLGGSHNFAVDQMAAEQLLKMMPSARNAARLNRWFMHTALDRLASAKFDSYLDLATGLPTEGYIHELVPHAQVLYNDLDPVTVEYARQIVGDNPKVRYLQQDIRGIDTILQVAEEHFANNRRIGIGFIGVSYFLPDDMVDHVLSRLYEWCAPGSQVAISWALSDGTDTRAPHMREMYQRMGMEPTVRSVEMAHGLTSQWTMLDPGLRPLTEWVSVDNWATEQSDADMVELYGCILERPA